MGKYEITEEIIDAINSWPDTMVRLADGCRVSTRTLYEWKRSPGLELSEGNYARLITMLELFHLWKENSIGVATLGSSLIRRTDGVLVTEIEQLNIDRALRGADTQRSSPQERLVALEHKIYECMIEIAKINMALKKNPEDDQLLFPLESDQQ